LRICFSIAIELFGFANCVIATQVELTPPPGDAVSALVFSPESSNKLLVASWDKNVYCYDLSNGASEAKLVNTYEHRAPVLDVCFGATDDEAYSAGMDWAVNR
jgi:cell cycle arrest protein BUB3